MKNITLVERLKLAFYYLIYYRSNGVELKELKNKYAYSKFQQMYGWNFYKFFLDVSQTIDGTLLSEKEMICIIIDHAQKMHERCSQLEKTYPEGKIFD